MALSEKDLCRIAEWHPAHYLGHIAPKIDFITRCMEHPEVKEIAMKEAGDTIEAWLSDPGHSGRIITEDRTARLLRHPSISGILDHIPYDGRPGRHTMRHDCVVSLLSYCIGKVCAGRKPGDIVPFIDHFSIDDEWTGFILAGFPDELIGSILHSARYQPASLRAFLARRRLDVTGLEEYYAQLSLDKILDEVDSPAFEYEFYILYDLYGFLGALVEANGSIKPFARYIAYLPLPQYQYEAAAAITSPDNLIEIARECAALSIAEDRKTVLSAIILRLWFQTMARVKAEHTIGLSTKDHRLMDIREYTVRDFDKNLNDRIRHGVETFTAMLGADFMSRWLFTKTDSPSSKENEETKAISEVLRLCRETFVENASLKGLDTDITDLNYLSAYAGILSGSDHTEEKASLSGAILKALRDDRQYLTGPLSAELLMRLDTLAGFLTEYLGGDTIKFFRDNYDAFKVRFAGIKATPYKELYDRTACESQFLMLSLYMTCLGDEDTRADDFMTVARYSLRQAIAAGDDLYFENFYLRILQLGELIADQHLQSIKTAYHRMCRHTLPSYTALLAILSQSARDIDTETKTWIESSHKTEWPVIEARLLSRGQTQTAAHYRQLYDRITTLRTNG